MKIYHGKSVPVPVQTPEYARALLLSGGQAQRSDREVEARRKRQEILVKANPPYVWIVLDEDVLDRPIGGREVMRAQLDYLLEVDELPHVSVRFISCLVMIREDRSTMDDPDLDEAWGPVPDGESRKARRQIMYINMIVSEWQMSFETKALPEARLRAISREMFSGRPGHAYWAEARHVRMSTAENKRARRFHQILDEEYQRAPAPPPERPRSRRRALLAGAAAGAAALVPVIRRRARRRR